MTFIDFYPIFLQVDYDDDEVDGPEVNPLRFEEEDERQAAAASGENHGTEEEEEDDSGRGSAVAAAAAAASRFNNGHTADDGGGGGLKTSFPPPVRHVSSEASEADAATNLLKTTSISDDQLLQVRVTEIQLDQF